MLVATPPSPQVKLRSLRLAQVENQIRWMADRVHEYMIDSYQIRWNTEWNSGAKVKVYID